MANPTSNFGWQMPTNTDLVTDLPADFETFGQAVDTSLADLKGGTTGQVLKKNSNTDMDFVWSADAAGMTNPMTTTGDTIYSSSGSTPARLGIGSTGQVLTVSGGVPTWASASGGTLSLAQIATGTMTSGSSLSLTGLSSYDRLILRVSDVQWGTANGALRLTVNNDSSAIYDRAYSFVQAQNTYTPTSLLTSNWNSDGSFVPFNGNGIINNSGINNFWIILDNCKATGFTTIQTQSFYRWSDGGTSTPGQSWGNFIYKSAAAVSSVEFFQSSGYTFSAGNYTIWGG